MGESPRAPVRLTLWPGPPVDCCCCCAASSFCARATSSLSKVMNVRTPRRNGLHPGPAEQVGVLLCPFVAFPGGSNVKPLAASCHTAWPRMGTHAARACMPTCMTPCNYLVACTTSKYATHEGTAMTTSDGRLRSGCTGPRSTVTR